MGNSEKVDSRINYSKKLRDIWIKRIKKINWQKHLDRFCKLCKLTIKLLIKIIRMIGKLPNFLGSIFLFIMFTLILFISADALFQAYRDLACTNEKITQSLSDIQVYMQTIYASQNTINQITPEAEAFLTCLKNQSNDTISSNSISFLFQVFSFCLISAGVYLLNRSQKNIKNVENQMKLASNLLTEGAITSAILGYAFEVDRISWLLLTTKDSEICGEYIVRILDLLTIYLKPQLKECAINKRAMEPSLEDRLIDLIESTNRNLHDYKNPSDIENLIKLCDDCIKILINSKFDENYRERLEKLQDSNNVM